MSKHEMTMGLMPLGDRVMMVGAMSLPVGALSSADTIRMCGALLSTSRPKEIKLNLLRKSWEPTDPFGDSLAESALMDMAHEPVWYGDNEGVSGEATCYVAMLKTFNLEGEPRSLVERRIFVSLIDRKPAVYALSERGAVYSGCLERTGSSGAVFKLTLTNEQLPAVRQRYRSTAFSLINNLTFASGDVRYCITSDLPVAHSHLCWQAIEAAGRGELEGSELLAAVRAIGMGKRFDDPAFLRRMMALVNETPLLKKGHHSLLTVEEFEELNQISRRVQNGF